MTADANRDTKQPRLEVNFALVEDNVRYQGENGVRFHRMVVRALPSPATSVPTVAPGTPTFESTFNVAQISQKLAAYLDSYETNHDPLRKVEFMSKDTTMNLNHLAVVAWVQDSTTHRVLQTRFSPVPKGK
jgi:hypothetical protein